MPESPMEVAALIPAYECARTIGAVAAGARTHVSRVVVVDDGSPDSTAEEAARAGAEVIRRGANGGKGAAIREGLGRILPDRDASHVLFLDGDGQHDPEEIPKLVEAARGGADFVVGSRLSARERIPAYRYETNRIGDMILSRMTALPIEDGASGYRLVEARLLVPLNLRANGYLIDNEILLKCAPNVRRFETVPVRPIYGSKSHYRPFRDTWKTSWGSVYVKIFET
jgi:glycosyltransferase involved in cell wall biosynthesis